jgi:hypothetical protein
MESEFKTSFIPKKPIVEEKFERPRSVGLISFIGTVIFVASLISAGAVYFYKATLNSQVKSKGNMLRVAEERFDSNLVEEMQKLDRRINSARDILSSHVIISPIFKALEEYTLRSISFTKFTYTFDPLSGRVNVDMSGKATGYDAIALQSDALVTNRYIKDPVFSNLNLDDKGKVTFDLTFYVDPTFINFEETLAREGTGITDTYEAGSEIPITSDNGATQ